MTNRHKKSDKFMKNFSKFKKGNEKLKASADADFISIARPMRGFKFARYNFYARLVPQSGFGVLQERHCSGKPFSLSSASFPTSSTPSWDKLNCDI